MQSLVQKFKNLSFIEKTLICFAATFFFGLIVMSKPTPQQLAARAAAHQPGDDVERDANAMMEVCKTKYTGRDFRDCVRQAQAILDQKYGLFER